MERLRLWLHRLLSLYLSITTTVLPRIFSFFLPQNIKPFPIFIPVADAILSLYFRFCGLSPSTVDLDDQTTMHYWNPTHRRFDRPNLVMLHGYGGNSRWQFVFQVGPLSESFNLYVPDLLFFGKSYTKRADRTEAFQARCVCEGLKGLGVERFSMYAISYGGYVGYRMAEKYPEIVEKVVIVSSGIGCSADQKSELLKKIGRKNVVDMLCPEKPEDLRSLVNLSVYKYDPFKWVPDFFTQEYINVMYKKYKKERRDMAEYLLSNKADTNLPVLTQEVLLIWGEKDRAFPLPMAYQLKRQLGPKAKLEIIKDTGHAANMESADSLNKLIKSFVLGASTSKVIMCTLVEN